MACVGRAQAEEVASKLAEQHELRSAWEAQRAHKLAEEQAAADAATSDTSATSGIGTQDAASTNTTASLTSSTVAGTPPSAVDSGQKSPMPTEIFVGIARHLAQRDLTAATQVCQSWRRALHASPPLWQVCSLYVDKAYAISKLRTWCMRANRSLSGLHVYLSPNSHHWDIEWMYERLMQIRKTILDFDGGANLSRLFFGAYDLNGYAYVALHSFCEYLLKPNYSTGYLCNPNITTTCDIKVPFHLFPVGQRFMHYFTAIDAVSLISRPAKVLDLSHQLDFIDLSSTMLPGPSEPVLGDPAVPARTQALVINSLNFMSSVIAPDFSNLSELQLSYVQIGRSFFYMLQTAAPQLEILGTTNIGFWLADLHYFEPDEFYQERSVLEGASLEEEDEEDLDEWDPARDRFCITLPNLRELRASGRKMDPWWQADSSEQQGQPDIYMPALRHAVFDDLDTLDESATPRIAQSPRRQKALEMQLEAGELPEFLEEEDDLSAAFPPLPALWNITSVARNLQFLDISKCFLSDQSLHISLRFATSLKTLFMRDMPDISDQGGLALCFLPQLRYVDIRGTDINAYTVARVYETIRDFGAGRLSRVLMDDPGPFYENEYAYKAYVAYTWLEWVGIVDDWQSREYSKAWLKRPWEDRNLNLEEAYGSSGCR